MAERVAATLTDGGVLVVEAGTGTGKSLAYLVPAIHWSLDRAERVIVSTNTIHLQEQLVRVDLPLLADHLGVRFRAALLKGRGNYLCLRKAAEVKAAPTLLGDGTSDEIRAILEWADDTDDGTLTDLPFVPRPQAWESVAAEHDDCLRARCPEYERCFFYKARKEAASAEILVVNHHLLLSDLQLRSVLPEEASSGILPVSSRLVIDEAHHLEDVTTDHFGGSISAGRIERTLRRLQHPRSTERGVLPALREKLLGLTSGEDRLTAKGAARWIDESLRLGIPDLELAATLCFDRLLLAATPLVPRTADVDDQRLRVTPEIRGSALWSTTELALRDLVAHLEAFVAEVDPVLDRIGMLSPGAIESTLFLARQLDALGARLGAAALELATFLEDTPELCRWFAVRRRAGAPPTLALEFAPVEAGPKLRDSLFAAFESVVLTSATLSVERRFRYFEERVGLDLLEEGRVQTLRLDSPFHYQDQALVTVPADAPFPDAPGYESALHELIAETVVRSGGGAFLLFTSYAALTRAHDVLAGRFRARRFPVLRQGEAGRSLLLERFRRDRASVLFATDSFWEGVDVRGEGLRAVVIARLPFRVPTEPIVVARSEAIESRGGSSFSDYLLPQAVIKLRQGFGRLIRSHDDAGVVVVADSRLARKPYGEVFLSSLPPARLFVGTNADVLTEVGKFFRGAP